MQTLGTPQHGNGLWPVRMWLVEECFCGGRPWAADPAGCSHAFPQRVALSAARPYQVLALSGATHMRTDAAAVSRLLRHQVEFLAESLGAPS